MEHVATHRADAEGRLIVEAAPNQRYRCQRTADGTITLIPLDDGFVAIPTRDYLDGVLNLAPKEL